MNCCDATIIPFEAVDELTIAYSAPMREAYGDVPSVFVFHLDAGEYVDMTRTIRTAVVGLPATELKIYNGGIATGFVKISK